MQRFALLLAFTVYTSIQLYAQKPTSNSVTSSQFLSVDLFWGYLHDHHSEMVQLKQSPAQAAKLSYGFKTNGNMLWHRVYGYPKVGISYTLTDLGQHNILGYAHTVSPFISIPVFGEKEKISFDVYAGVGLAYMSKFYHPITNSKNLTISTPLNASIDFGLNTSYPINNNLKFHAGVHLTHFSNGSIRKPNYGLNYTMLTLGMQYGDFSIKPTEYKGEEVKHETHRVLVTISGSTKQAVSFNDTHFGVGSGSIEYSYEIWSSLIRIGGSLDFMYDNSQKLILQNSNVLYGTNWDLTKYGVAVNTEFILNRLSLILHFGGYYHNLSRDIKNQWVYQRVGLRYRFANNLWAHVALKTHLNLADYIEFGLALKVFGHSKPD